MQYKPGFIKMLLKRYASLLLLHAFTLQSTRAAKDPGPLDGEEVALYMDTCLPNTGHTSLKQLYHTPSCPPPRPDLRCTSPRDGWALDAATARCQQVRASCDTDRIYDTRLECQYRCEAACAQERDPGVEDCDQDSYTAYYYNSSSRLCLPFTYSGCGGNKNNFDSALECRQVCAPSPVVKATGGAGGEDGDTFLPGRQRRAAAVGVRGVKTLALPRKLPVVLPSRQTNASFCSQVDAAYPQVKTIMNNIQDQSAGTTKKSFFGARAGGDGGNDVDDLYKLITTPAGSGVEGEERSRRQLNPGGLIPRRLTWATVIRRKQCRRFDVTVRLYCLGAVFKGPPNSTERKRLCGLIRQGIEKYWSRNITYKGQTWEVRVRTKETFFLSKKIIIKYYTSNSGNTRSHNSDIWFLTMKYRAFLSNADQDFILTAAHELSHSVLMSDKGLVWSWGHKGSSTIFGKTKDDAPFYPSSGEIDLAIYHRGSRPSDFYDRVILAESDARALIRGATFYFPLPWCPGAVGAPCIKDSQCHAGRCHWLRCVECEANSHCRSDQYCHGTNNPLVVNRCRSKKNRGEVCVHDSMCKSSRCSGLRCVDCESDSHCSAATYCAGLRIPLDINTCKTRKNNGAVCSRDRQCRSGHCDGLRCSECEANSHCGAGKYCKNMNIPLVTNKCEYKKNNGALCTRDSVCKSGHCNGLRCTVCEADSHCGSGKYCRNKSIPLVTNTCANKKCKGWCSRGSMCKSGKCRWFRCKKC